MKSTWFINTAFTIYNIAFESNMSKLGKLSPEMNDLFQKSKKVNNYENLILNLNEGDFIIAIQVLDFMYRLYENIQKDNSFNDDVNSDIGNDMYFFKNLISSLIDKKNCKIENNQITYKDKELQEASKLLLKEYI